MTGEEAQSTASQAEQPPSSIVSVPLHFLLLPVCSLTPSPLDLSSRQRTQPAQSRAVLVRLRDVVQAAVDRARAARGVHDRVPGPDQGVLPLGHPPGRLHRQRPARRAAAAPAERRPHRQPRPPPRAARHRRRVRILHRDDPMGLLVVVKPGSIPVHAAGRYFKHTLLEMLKSDHGLDGVYTLNRLDRLTSGIMVLATRKDAATKLGKHFAQGTVQKHYVCPRPGPLSGVAAALAAASTPSAVLSSLQAAQAQDQQAAARADDDDGGAGASSRSTCRSSASTGSRACASCTPGKECTTLFTRLRYDAASDTSVVWCRPITGRTHQIRVHVQYLGHPIVNDPIYAHAVWRAGGRSSSRSPAPTSTRPRGRARAGRALRAPRKSTRSSRPSSSSATGARTGRGGRTRSSTATCSSRRRWRCPRFPA